MSLLVLDTVTKRLRHGRAVKAVLAGVTMDIAAGELVGIRGRRRSGRTTLLQVASGLLAPDDGTVTFAGRNIAAAGRARLGHEIAWAEPTFDSALGHTIVDQVAFPLLTEHPRGQALRYARRMLNDVGVGDLTGLRPSQCQQHELLLASLARAMVLTPRLLIIDEPVTGLNSRLAEQIMELLRAFALNGTAVLFTEEEAQLGVDRTLTIADGRVGGNTVPASADVIPLRGVSA